MKKSFIMVVIGLLGIVSIINAQNGPWTTKRPLSKRNSWLTSCTLDGKIYVIGGTKSPNYGGYSKVEEYDPATDTWKTKAEMPTRRLALSASVVEGKIYTIGGAIVSYPWIPSVATVEEYDPSLDQPTDVGNPSLMQHPNQFLLSQNYPNPFNPETTIEYELANPAYVKISIYNISGQTVKILKQRFQTAGSYKIQWNSRNSLDQVVPNGIYILEMLTNGHRQTRRMLLLK